MPLLSKARMTFCELVLGLLQVSIKANPGQSYFPSVYWDEGGNLGPDSPEEQMSVPQRGVRLQAV